MPITIFISMSSHLHLGGRRFALGLVFISLALLFLSESAKGLIEIKSLLVPDRVENGSTASVILDCIYTFDAEDDKKLVVKWFYRSDSAKNDDPVPLYQWIPELNSRTLSPRFKGKVNLDFAVNTGNPYTTFRAVNIINITTDLSGRYSCHVGSLKSSDYKEKTMLVYAPPKNITFDFRRIARLEAPSRNLATTSGSPSSSGRELRPSAEQSAMSREMMALSGSANELSPGAMLKCFVEDVFPKPEIAIYRLSNDGRRYPLLDAKRKEALSANRAHNIEISAQVVDAELTRKYGKEPYTFECLMHLDINGSNITKSSLVSYFYASSSAPSCNRRPLFTVSSLLAALACALAIVEFWSHTCSTRH